MSKWAYYNDIDPIACAVTREAIRMGIICDGEVDERSIYDVDAHDLRGFQQLHFFCGAGLWSIACRLAGWKDCREIVTASVPCQPLSVAGLRQGHVDARHVWPAFYRLVAERRPAVIVGEQVASKDGREWFAGVRADLEALGYACGAADLPACGVGAPHRRNRLWWVAVADADARGQQVIRQPEWSGLESPSGGFIERRHADGRLDGPRAVADAEHAERWPDDDLRRGDDAEEAQGRLQGAVKLGERDGSSSGAMADADQPLLRQVSSAGQQPDVQQDARDHGGGQPMADAAGERRREGRPERQGRVGIATSPGPDGAVNMGDALREGLERQRGNGDDCRQSGWIGSGQDGPVATADDSFWSDAVWLRCADGKARRAKPGLRLLVDGMAGRTDLWRLAGNSIVPQLAAAFLSAVMEAIA